MQAVEPTCADVAADAALSAASAACGKITNTTLSSIDKTALMCGEAAVSCGG